MPAVSEELLNTLRSNDLSVSTVNLHFCDLSDEDVPELAQALEVNNVVRSLLLDGNSLSLGGFDKLLTSLSNHGTITRYSFCGYEDLFGDEGAALVAKFIRTNRVVESIALEFNEITETGLAALDEALDDNKSLTKIDLEGNEFSLDSPAHKRLLEKLSRTRLGSLDTGVRRAEGSTKSVADLEDEIRKMQLKLSEAEQEKKKAEEDRREAEAAVAKSSKSSARSTSNVVEIDPDQIELMNKIGAGAFAKVYKAKWLGKVVAYKKMKADKMNVAVMDSYKKELGLLAALRHPNIVLLMGACTSGKALGIVTEFLPGGSLFDLLEKHRLAGTRLEPHLRNQIAYDVAAGMAYLHGQNPPVIHRDLKSLNVLLDNHNNAKVADFGLSREMDSDKTMTLGVGTPHWLAPEVLKQEPYTEKADVYAYGVMLYELESCEIPFTGFDPIMLISKIYMEPDFRPTITDECDGSFRKLILDCWSTDADSRPSFARVMQYCEEHLGVTC